MNKSVEKGMWFIIPPDNRARRQPGENQNEPDKNEKAGDGFESPYEETGESFGI